MALKIPSPLVILIAIIAVLIPTYKIYSKAIGADFNFDDIPNLLPLATVHDLQSALSVIFTGTAGPLGRPLAITSFVIQFYAWPYSPETFLYANILLHLVNCILVLWLGLLIAQSTQEEKLPIVAFSITLFSLWALQPLLASASLLVIQRMTTLSATFVLTGLIGYLKGRNRVLLGQSCGTMMMAGSIFLASILAGLTKETGLLLPIYVLTLEVTIFASTGNNPIIKTWKRLLYIPLLIVIYYISIQLKYFFEPGSRGFSSWERLLTEGPILWEYVRLLFFPNVSLIGPYHDDIQIARGVTLASSAAWLAWITLIIFAVKNRKATPWVSFATGWFLAGHALESTIFNLELYFEHRNYVPSIGPLAAFSYLVVKAAQRWQAATIFATAIYIFLFGFILNEITLTWGNPDLAAQLWADRHPRSERAQQFLAQRYTTHRDYIGALKVINHAFKNNPQSAGLAMQSLQLSCALKLDISEQRTRARSVLIAADLDFATLDALKKLVDIYKSDGCQGLDAKYLHGLIDTMLANPNYERSTPTAFSLHHFKTGLYIETHELDPAVRHLEFAFERLPDLDTAVLLAGLLDSAGLEDEALVKIHYFNQQLPVNPVMRRQWVARLSEIEEDLKHRIDSKRTELDIK